MQCGAVPNAEMGKGHDARFTLDSYLNICGVQNSIIYQHLTLTLTLTSLSIYLRRKNTKQPPPLLVITTDKQLTTKDRKWHRLESRLGLGLGLDPNPATASKEAPHRLAP